MTNAKRSQKTKTTTTPSCLKDLIGRREPNALWQFFAGITIFIVSQLAVGVVLWAGGATGAENAQEVIASPAKEWMFLGAMTVGAALSMVLFALVISGPGGRKPFEIRGPGAMAELGIGLVIGAGLISITVAVLWLIGSYKVTGFGWSAQIIMIAGIGIGAGVMEEILFRGFLLRLLEKRIGTGWALVVTAALFGSVHLVNGGVHIWGTIAIALEAGLLLGAAYILTRRLWLVIGIHIAWNFVQGAVWSSPISGTGESNGLVRADFIGSDWLTGGVMGLEGSLIAVVVCAGAGSYMCYLAYKRGNFIPRPSRRG